MTMPGAGLMARAKTKKAVTPPPAIELERESIVNMKGSPEYAGWLEGVHKKTHIPKVQIIRLALSEWAEKHGHTLPPEI
jgi:hypothetical protein